MTAFPRPSLLFVVVPLALASGLACGPGPALDEDAGGGGPNVPLPVLRDGGMPPLPDANGPSDEDAGQSGSDAGRPDAGPGDDAGPLPDAGGPPTDAGQPDGGVPVVLTSVEGGPCYEAAGAVCEDGLVCAPFYVSGAGTCARPCDVEGQACAGGGTCSDYGTDSEPFLVCATPVADGGGCDPEQLVVCSGEGLCIPDDDAPLGGTCRTPCTCQTGTTCSTSTCAASTCVVTDLTTGDGFCGAAAQVGQPCDPIGGGVFCEGNASCLIDVLGNGTCRLRCETPGPDDPACAGNTECFGDPGDGFCLPTTDLGQGELCTDGTTTPVIPLTCAAGFGCIHTDDQPAGLGLCLEACSAVDDPTCETGGCYSIDPPVTGGGVRCLTELPRGDRGCDGLAAICEGDNGVCVTLADDDTICKQRCTIAAPTECAGGETCVTTFLASPDVGVCGTLVGEGEACDEDDDVYCAPAPGEATAGNAFSTCVAEQCRFICRYPDATTTEPVDLACPAGMECRPDPTGRLLETVHICVTAP